MEENEANQVNREDLAELLHDASHMRMPFGRFGPEEYPDGGVVIMDLPPEYLAWFSDREFPQGRLGEVMTFVHEVKSVGADEIFFPARKTRGGRTRLHK